MSPSPQRSETLIDLGGGFQQAGIVHRQAAVRGIAHQAWAIWNVDFGQPLECVVTSLLAIASPQLEWSELHSLNLADRHALIRGVWLLDGGGPAQAAAECPECGEGSEFELDLAGIEVLRSSGVFTVRLGEQTMTCKLPTPSMMETASDAVDAVACCLGVDRAEAEPWVHVVEEALTEHDPLGDIVLVGPCVSCGRTLHAAFDLKAAWVRWLRRCARRLMADVHVLARHYHWSEDEILRIPESRRQVYLDFCEVEEPVEA